MTGNECLNPRVIRGRGRTNPSCRCGVAIVAVLLSSMSLAARAQCPPVHVFDGEAPNDGLGLGISGAGDVDGDGCDDVLVGAPGYDLPTGGQSRGRVYLYSGATGELLRDWIGEQSTYGGGGAFGRELATGDIDADGVPDVIVAAPTFGTDVGSWVGRVSVFSGATGQRIWFWDGDRPDDGYGTTIDGAGDVDGDGYDDVVVGQPGFGDGDIEFPGRVFVYSGRTGELLWSRFGDAPGEHFGYAVGGAGDFNGDGFDDVITGAVWCNPSKAYVLSGPTGEVIWYQEYMAESAGDIFGAAVSGVGDINDDGFADVVIGAPFAGGPTPYADYGMAFVFTGPDGELLWSWEGEGTTDYFGWSVAGTGDVNGDEVPDMLIGAYSVSGPAGWMSGRAYVYSGATGLLLWSADGEAAGDFFALRVRGAGDVDGDGLGDVIAGADWHDGPAGANAGRAYVFRPVVPADCDCNGETTSVDYVVLNQCLRGADREAVFPDCACVDLDGDGDIDLGDFAVFQVKCGTGPIVRLVPISSAKKSAADCRVAPLPRTQRGSVGIV